MLYTRDFPTQLKNQGYKLDFEENDEECNYEVWDKGFLSVTVDHAIQKVSVFIQCDTDVELNDIKILNSLDTLLNNL